MTDRQRIRFACDLVRLPVDEMTPPDQVQWERRLAQFFEGMAKSGAVGRPLEWEGRQTRETRLDHPQDWINLREFSAALLRAAIGDAAKLPVFQYAQEFKPPGLLIIRSSVATTFGRILTGALMVEGLDRLARCEWCELPFVRGRSDRRCCGAPACERKRQAGYWARWAAKHDRKRRVSTQARRGRATAKRADRS